MANAPWSVEKIIQALRNKEYRVFESPDFTLNIVGVRTGDATVNKFNDFMYLFWKNGSAWDNRVYEITTDPGLFWLQNPDNLKGTAVLKAGQYIDSHKIGFHNKSKPARMYPALEQNKPLPVYRDNNRDNVLNFDESTLDEGMFGINIHKAGLNSIQVDKWSAGCQVFANESDFEEFMRLCDQSAQQHGDVFTYTLLNETDIG